ncbi:MULTISPECIES: hypothetical protein [Clostridia]|mgnify:CR=1 FL=1|uniref:hypothetical protein n=1 Tax=Clostridia TaxID=186801 RepID=UPI000E4DAF3C|nr:MULTISPECIES: hypothetical protein [Clostridia]RHV70233.1 hypothetical protein DXB15_08000 [Roseburia sp. OM02-15]
MSQKAVFVRINGQLLPKIFSTVPDYNDAVKLCMHCDSVSLGKNLQLDYEWIEIGDGKSGVDTFYDDNLLLFLYNTFGYEDILRSAGDAVRTVEQGSYTISCETSEMLA